MFRHGKKDDNHNEIAGHFQALGFSWCDMQDLGDGKPDGIAGKGKYNILVEVKKNKKSKLTVEEEGFHNMWRGPIWIVCDLFDIIDQWYKLTGETIYDSFGNTKHKKGA